LSFQTDCVSILSVRDSNSPLGGREAATEAAALLCVAAFMTMLGPVHRERVNAYTVVYAPA
jgi:hypothetical protein